MEITLLRTYMSELYNYYVYYSNTLCKCVKLCCLENLGFKKIFNLMDFCAKGLSLGRTPMTLYPNYWANQLPVLVSMDNHFDD